MTYRYSSDIVVARNENLRQLFGDVAAHEDGLEINPQVLDDHPVLNDVRRVGQLLHPVLDILLEWSVVPVQMCASC